MQRIRAWLWLVFVLALLVPVASLAQHTGGSFGGSSWGSGRSSSSSSSRSSGSSWGGGSRSSGSSWGSSRSSWGGGSSSSGGSYGGGSYGSYGGGSSNGGGGAGALCCVVLFFVVVILIGMALSKKKGSNVVSYTPSQGGFGGMPGGDFTPETFSLGALAIAFDATVRAQVQGELDRIAGSMQMQNTPDALENAARTMSTALARYLDSAYMTHHAVSQGLSMQMTQQQFQAAVDQERGRYIVETVRADAGGVRKINAPASRGRAEEGGGFVVVTLLIARRGNLTGFVPATTRDALRNDLQVLLAGPGALQAMEVVWVPSDPNDVMSSAEMAVKFPTLKPIAPDARVGRRACGHYKSVYAAELGVCPNCGAPPA